MPVECAIALQLVGQMIYTNSAESSGAMQGLRHGGSVAAGEGRSCCQLGWISGSASKRARTFNCVMTSQSCCSRVRGNDHEFLQILKVRPLDSETALDTRFDLQRAAAGGCPLLQLGEPETQKRVGRVHCGCIG